MKKTIILISTFLIILLNGFGQSIVGPVLNLKLQKSMRRNEKGLAAGKGTATGTIPIPEILLKATRWQGTYTYMNGDVYQGAFRNGSWMAKELWP